MLRNVAYDSRYLYINILLKKPWIPGETRLHVCGPADLFPPAEGVFISGNSCCDKK